MNDVIALPERDRDHERVLGIVFGISPAQASTLSCLLRSVMASGDQLLEYTETKSNMKVVISRTRHKIAEHGFDIKSKNGVGYWIETEDKKAIEKMAVNFVEGRA